MITNYYTLFHMAAELEHGFAGLSVKEIFTQHRNELIISFIETPAVIIIGCEPSNNYIYARKTFARARRNSVTFFNDIYKSTLVNISIHSFDRQIRFHFINKDELFVQLFGSKANVFMIDSSGNIKESFLKKPETKFIANETSSQHQYIITPKDFLSTYHDFSLSMALKRIFPLFGSVLLREALNRTGINGVILVAHLDENAVVKLLKTALNLIEDLRSSPSPRVYYEGDSTVGFSIIPLQHLNKFQFLKYDSLSEAIQTYEAKRFHEILFLREKGELLRVLERERDHTERTLKKIISDGESLKYAEKYDLYGKLLMAQLHLFKKGDTEVLVEDFISGSRELIEIPLDPHLSPAKNAGRYFEKAEKSRSTAEKQKQHIAELANRKKHIDQLLDQLEEIVTTDELKGYAEKNRKALAEFGLVTEKSGKVTKEKSVPFRVFTVSGGFQVWAGKSGENNDLLSTRLTAKNDLWFHARGVGGSHVVLKIGTGKGEVSKQAIEQAAAIAAYYSKMKNSKLVPVAMCEGKYVRKPKGVPAGTVILEREKTIFVKPGLPES